MDWTEKILDIKESIAVKINPAFYQLFNTKNDDWYYEQFINIASYERDGSFIISLADDNEFTYRNRINTRHTYHFNEVPAANFYMILVQALAGNQYINIWCDEYYIRESIRYQKTHFVHPLTVYGIRGGNFLCQFFAIHKGMCLIEVPAQDLLLAFYSIKAYYQNGATESILETAMSMYTVKQTDTHSFNIDLFVNELKNYLYGRASPYRLLENCCGADRIIYGIAYYNELLKTVQNFDCPIMNIPYKCLFDLNIHKKLLMERLQYVKNHLRFGEEFDEFLEQIKTVSLFYEQINMLNIKYNIQNGIAPYMLSQDIRFRKKLGEILTRAYMLETDLIFNVIHFIEKKQDDNFKNWSDSFDICIRGNDLLFKPRFDEYVGGMHFKYNSDVDKPQTCIYLSNGHIYFPETTGVVNTYSFRPIKLDWIKITNCKMPDALVLDKVSSDINSEAGEYRLKNIHPINDISNWHNGGTCISFDIKGRDPYLVCDGLAIDADRFPYVKLEYSCDSIVPTAQLFFMTDESPAYSPDKCITFNRITVNERYVYKFDLSDELSWNSLVTFVRLDPIHCPSNSGIANVEARCVIYNIAISSKPHVYNNRVDFCGCQEVNQWEYCVIRNGIKLPLLYSSEVCFWKDNEHDSVFIGPDSQSGCNDSQSTRIWRCPAIGRYRVQLSGDSNNLSTFWVMQDEKVLYENNHQKMLEFEATMFLEKDSSLAFISTDPVVNMNIEIVKVKSEG